MFGALLLLLGGSGGSGRQYRVYSNDGAGGPVDYSTPIATVSTLTYTPTALPHSSSTTFAVRAYDPATGLEEENTDARVTILIDASGNDVSARPNSPQGISARAGVAGAVRVEWAYVTSGQGAAPTYFDIWYTAGSTVNYAASPLLSVAHTPGRLHYAADLPPQAGGVAAVVGVRARNANGRDPNTASAAVTPIAAAPSPPTATSVVGSPPVVPITPPGSTGP